MLNADTDKLELKRAPLASQLADLENTFYSSVYKNLPAQYVIILETLIKQGTCQLCGTHAAHLRTLGHNLKRENKCVVCRSPVNNDYSDKGLDKQHLTKQINELRDQLDALDATQAQYLKVQGTAKREIDNLHVAISDKHKQQRRMETEIAELRTKYIIAGGTSSSTEGDQDVWVEEQEKRIQKLTSEIETLYRKRDEVTVKLKELNQEVLTVLRNVNQRLTLLFSRFASQFLGTPCELVVSHKTKAKKPNAYMYPRFHERERENINQVSESQRFFIDQAFRMALITWYTEETGQPTLCIVETPEGSLDLAYEQNVAKMYTEFASYGHSIIARLCCTNIEPLL
jgi:hypothetical protein